MSVQAGPVATAAPTPLEASCAAVPKATSGLGKGEGLEGGGPRFPNPTRASVRTCMSAHASSHPSLVQLPVQTRAHTPLWCSCLRGAPAYLHINTCRCTLPCSALEHVHDSHLCQHRGHPYAFVDLSVHMCTHNTHQRYGVPAGPHLCPRGAKGCTHTCACVGTHTRHSCTLTHQHPSPRATWLRMESGSWRGWRGQNPTAFP